MRNFLLSVVVASALSAVGSNTFRVTPYVQRPSPTAMTVMWLAQEAGEAEFTYWKIGSSATTTLMAVLREGLSDDTTGARFKTDNVLEYCRAPELGYDMDPEGGNDKERGGGWDLPATVPWQYRVRVTGLEADTAYGYRVQLTGGASYENTFRTAPDPRKWRGVKFIYFSDSETEPADNDPSSGRTSDWMDPVTGANRKYFATQTEAYAANIRAAQAFGTELIVMAGDLAQRGSRQCDWDEFWRHNAGPLNDPAASIPILASPGNHDYWSYRDGGNVGITKYLSYFEYEPNAANVGKRQHELFHRVDYGPVTFLFMDACNGDDAVLEADTSRQLARTDADGSNNGCIAPDFNPGSVMYNWLEEQLKDAQKNSAFTFVVCHQCPYSCGAHGGPIGEKGNSQGLDTQSGRALRVLEPLFHKYGVDGWFCGHDEMMERSEISGTETLADGTEAPHKFNVWDMGIAGDGLRGWNTYPNPYQSFRAHVDCPEVYEDGVLVDGGKHYGHLEVTVDQTEDGRWRATFDPIYVFYSKDKDGNTVYGGVRHYADKIVRISNRCPGAAPAPQTAWTYSGGVLTSSDGWSFPVSAAEDGVTIGQFSAVGTEKTLNFQSAEAVIGASIVALNSTFYDEDTIQEVWLPTGLKRIEYSAFWACAELTTVEPFLPETVEYLGDWVFVNCPKLTGDLVLSNPNLSIERHGYGAGAFMGTAITSADLSATRLPYLCEFYECHALKWVKLPQEGLTELGDWAFYNCFALETIEPFVPKSVETLGVGLFKGCGALTGDFVLANKKATGGHAGSWGDGMFLGLRITSADFSKSSMETIEPGITYESATVRKVIFPKTVKSLADGNWQFYHCTALMDLQFMSYPSNVGTISGAFDGTPSTGRVVYPKGDSGWEGYIDGLKAAGQFTPWDPASEAAQAYFANFPDGWKPLGYTTALGGKWLVPHNYESGLTLLFQ